jgi:hypothetical protein
MPFTPGPAHAGYPIGRDAASTSCHRQDGAGQQPFAFACGHATPGHHGRFLAGLELPEQRFHGAGVAGCWSRCPALFGGPARPAGVFGQRREEPQLVLVGAGEALLAYVSGIGEHGAQPRCDADQGQLLAAGAWQWVQQVRPAGAGTAPRRR